ncbi:MAG: ribosome silencing factor [Planctomycetota bacterium]|nr:MAG: ribosome silencing factor [Planctomycetota bacterium]
MTEQLDQSAFAEGSKADPAEVRAFALEAARSLRDSKCEQIVVLDVRGLSHVTDYIVIGSGTSQRQMGSALQHVEELGQERRFERLRTSRDDQSLWLLADFVDVVVHLFEPNTRAHYDLEMLWGDAPRVDWDGSNSREQP